jgi:GT2 family glycosyltransferase
MSTQVELASAVHGNERVSRRLGACVVSFNRREKLTKAVAALLDQGVHHLVIVDNGSTDGSREWLASLDDERLEVIESAVNLGGAGGFELGMRRMVANHETDWILLQDDDAWPRPGALDAFRSLPVGADVGGVAAAVYTTADEVCEINRPGLNPFHGLRGVIRAVLKGRPALHVGDEAYGQLSTDVDCASFVGLFVRTGLVTERLGFPRGELFIYSDDQLYSFAIRRAGYRILFVPSIVFSHDTVSKSDAGYFSPVWKVFFLYRNNIEFYRAMASRWFPLVMIFKLPVWVLRVRHYPDRRAYLRMLRLGVTDGFRRRFDRPLDEVLAQATRSVER